jgi:hypothetical protein
VLQVKDPSVALKVPALLGNTKMVGSVGSGVACAGGAAESVS